MKEALIVTGYVVFMLFIMLSAFALTQARG